MNESFAEPLEEGDEFCIPSIPPWWRVSGYEWADVSRGRWYTRPFISVVLEPRADLFATGVPPDVIAFVGFMDMATAQGVSTNVVATMDLHPVAHWIAYRATSPVRVTGNYGRVGTHHVAVHAGDLARALSELTTTYSDTTLANLAAIASRASMVPSVLQSSDPTNWPAMPWPENEVRVGRVCLLTRGRQLRPGEEVGLPSQTVESELGL